MSYSWSEYIDQLMASGKFTQVAIIGQQGGYWAKSDGFQLSQEDLNNVLSAFQTESIANIQGAGFRLADEKYVGLEVNDSTIKLKKGPDGAFLLKTKLAILVAFYNEPIQTQEAFSVVDHFAKHLIGSQY